MATDVTRTYELDGVSVPALRGVSLTVDAGDYVAIVGTSGSGKSTLMHLLGGLDRPTGGTLLIGGRDVATLDPAEMARLRNETIGFVFQSFHLLARTTARDNVALPLVYRGVGRRERRARAAEMLDRVGLGAPPRPPAQPDVRRRAAAGGDRPGPGHRPVGAAGRRAHRQPRLDHRPVGARPAGVAERRRRRGRAGHPRPGGGRPGRTARSSCATA